MIWHASSGNVSFVSVNLAIGTRGLNIVPCIQFGPLILATLKFKPRRTEIKWLPPSSVNVDSSSNSVPSLQKDNLYPPRLMSLMCQQHIRSLQPGGSSPDYHHSITSIALTVSSHKLSFHLFRWNKIDHVCIHRAIIAAANVSFLHKENSVTLPRAKARAHTVDLTPGQLLLWLY